MHRTRVIRAIRTLRRSNERRVPPRRQHRSTPVVVLLILVSICVSQRPRPFRRKVTRIHLKLVSAPRKNSLFVSPQLFRSIAHSRNRRRELYATILTLPIICSLKRVVIVVPKCRRCLCRWQRRPSR